MANDTLSSIQYSLSVQEEKLRDVTTRRFKSKIMGFLKDGNKVSTLAPPGRTQYRYFNDTYVPAGASAAVAESGNYPDAQAEVEAQFRIALKFFPMTIGFTEHALTSLETDPGKVVPKVQSKIRMAVRAHQERLERLITGRGDGMVARASAAGSSATTVTSSIPTRVVVGDLVYNKQDTSGNARGLAGTTEVNGARVVDMDLDAYSFELDAADDWSDNGIFYVVAAAHNADGAGVHINGLESHCDSSVDNWQWDDDDDATYDHVDTYMNGTRGTSHGLNVQEVDGASGYLTMELVSQAVRKCMGKGANPNDLVVICHPKQYELIAMNEEGYKVKTGQLELVGGNYTIPYIDGFEGGRLKVISDPCIMNTEVIVLDTANFYKMSNPNTTKWNKRAGGSMWREGATSTAYVAHFDTWLETCLHLPKTSCVIYDLLAS